MKSKKTVIQNQSTSHQSITLRDYLLRYTKIKQVKPSSQQNNLFEFEIKPEELFEVRVKDLIRFISEKLEKKDIKLFNQLRKKVLEIESLFQKSINRWKGSFDLKKYENLFKKQYQTKSSTPYQPSQIKEEKTSSSHLQFQKYEKKLSIENNNLPQSKKALTEINRSIKTVNSMKFDQKREKKIAQQSQRGFDKIRENKNILWNNSSKIIEQKEDQDTFFHQKDGMGKKFINSKQAKPPKPPRTRMRLKTEAMSITQMIKRSFAFQ